MLQTPVDTDIRLIQSSPGRTGSTLLTNILHGLYYDKPVFYSKNIEPIILQNNFIVKTHDINFNQIISNNKDYNIFFICSERQELNQTINIKYKNYSNVIVFSYEKELKEKENFKVSDIVNGIYTRLASFLPDNINSYANIDGAITRIINMNNFYETIKNLSFSYYDDFYKIHGSHRDRKHI